MQFPVALKVFASRSYLSGRQECNKAFIHVLPYVFVCFGGTHVHSTRGGMRVVNYLQRVNLHLPLSTEGRTENTFTNTK